MGSSSHPCNSATLTAVRICTRQRTDGCSPPRSPRVIYVDRYPVIQQPKDRRRGSWPHHGAKLSGLGASNTEFKKARAKVQTRFLQDVFTKIPPPSPIIRLKSFLLLRQRTLGVPAKVLKNPGMTHHLGGLSCQAVVQGGANKRQGWLRPLRATASVRQQLLHGFRVVLRAILCQLPTHSTLSGPHGRKWYQVVESQRQGGGGVSSGSW